VMTLGLFQNGTIRHVAGQRIQIARDDTLSDPGAVSRWADALRRGASCNIDVMNLDHFEYKNLDIEEVQDRFGVLPKETDAEPVV
jgi:aminoglycoside N3'-acetyltransferase